MAPGFPAGLEIHVLLQKAVPDVTWPGPRTFCTITAEPWESPGSSRARWQLSFEGQTVAAHFFHFFSPLCRRKIPPRAQGRTGFREKLGRGELLRVCPVLGCQAPAEHGAMGTTPLALSPSRSDLKLVPVALTSASRSRLSLPWVASQFGQFPGHPALPGSSWEPPVSCPPWPVWLQVLMSP